MSTQEIQRTHYRLAAARMDDTRLMAGTPQPQQDDGLLEKRIREEAEGSAMEGDRFE